MIRNDSRRGASNLGMPLMLLAFALMGGLVYWLAVTAEPTETVVVEEEAPDVDMFTGTEIDAAVLETPQITGYEGLEVRVADVPFTQAVGTRQFFVSLPQGSPFLIRMGRRLIADSVPMPTEGTLTVTGNLYALTDSIRNAWQAEGAIDGASRPLVNFSAHFIEATNIRAGAPAAPATDSSAAGTQGQGG